MVEVNIYYQRYRKRMEINVIRRQKWTVILGIPWLAHYNPEIDQKIGGVKMIRCPEEYGKQWRPKQGKLEQQKQREEEAKEEVERKQEEWEKRRKMVKIKRIAEEWEIQDEEREVARSEIETRKLVPEKFHQWIKIFEKKQSERIPTRKVQDHTIKVKEEFIPRKEKMYLLLKGEREEIRKFIKEQLRKEYIQPSKSLQTVPVFFVEKKNGKKQMV